ncbi:hypothetical protein BDU57DRAFT_493695 [Ampelomyces quisqualis]|uniref:DUF6594 domain-containing protein n=1 Tax=Ampelomyces quisqualis TaxID=50730 RepID=A0A6A5QPD5_AMPQU|nr:hypothetical protein BDU57DRAFT_493695 [Ampelomyces quisqualis]
MLEKAMVALEHIKNKNQTQMAEGWKNHPIGYPRLAERIAAKPETGVYRRFDALNARHVLYLQAELCVHEAELRDQEIEDQQDKTGKRSQYALDYQCFLQEPSNMNKPQFKLVQKMHAKLAEYNDALIQTSLLHKLEAPDKFDLDDIQLFLSSDDMGPNEMKGLDADSWGDCDAGTYLQDLVGIHPSRKEDLFSRIVAEKGIYLFRFGLGHFTKGNKHFGKRVYYDSTVLKMTFCLTSTIAAMLPVASILILYHLHSVKAQLWTIAGFNVLISICPTFITDAKRTDVFPVNAA